MEGLGTELSIRGGVLEYLFQKITRLFRMREAETITGQPSRHRVDVCFEDSVATGGECWI